MTDPRDNASDSPIKKKVDESWKDTAEKEKEITEQEAPDPSSAEPEFSSFLSTLGMQAFFALGELQDPASVEKKIDLVQAKYLIDIIQILSDKTEGNLSQEEVAMLKELLYGLKIKFVEKAGTIS